MREFSDDNVAVAAAGHSHRFFPGLRSGKVNDGVDHAQFIQVREKIFGARGFDALGFDRAAEAGVADGDCFRDALAGEGVVHFLGEFERSVLFLEGDPPCVPVEWHGVDERAVAVKDECVEIAGGKNQGKSPEFQGMAGKSRDESAVMN